MVYRMTAKHTQGRMKLWLAEGTHTDFKLSYMA
jgi:hypothetical protein